MIIDLHCNYMSVYIYIYYIFTMALEVWKWVCLGVVDALDHHLTLRLEVHPLLMVAQLGVIGLQIQHGGDV